MNTPKTRFKLSGLLLSVFKDPTAQDYLEAERLVDTIITHEHDRLLAETGKGFDEWADNNAITAWMLDSHKQSYIAGAASKRQRWEKAVKDLCVRIRLMQQCKDRDWDSMEKPLAALEFLLRRSVPPMASGAALTPASELVVGVSKAKLEALERIAEDFFTQVDDENLECRFCHVSGTIAYKIDHSTNCPVAALAPASEPKWWCCSADYPNHEPSCKNYKAAEGEQ